MGNFQKPMLTAREIQFSDDGLNLLPLDPRHQSLARTFRIRPYHIYTSLEDSSGYDDDGSSASTSAG